MTRNAELFVYLAARCRLSYEAGHGQLREAAQAAKGSSAVIRINMIRQEARHPDKRRRHQGRTSCKVAGRRFETEGPAPIYMLVTLLWLHGHGGEHFEVWDDRSPFGRPGGLAMTGRVRNWVLISNGRPVFTKDARPDPSFTLDEQKLVARVAGQVMELAEKDSSRAYKARTDETRPSDAEYLQQQDGASTGPLGALVPEAAE